MSANSIPLDVKSAEEHLLRFLAIEGLSGEEAAIAVAVSDELKKVGVPESAIRYDKANERISLPTQTGNLYADLPGTREGARLLFATHLDTVPICAGAKPKRDGGRIVTDGTTGLGGDNRTGCAVLVVLAETLLKHKLPHPPITLLFTVREESGLQGAKHIDPADLRGATMCFNVDSKVPADLIIGAVGQETWEVEIKGQAAHAGVAPEKGVSSTLVASLALAEAYRQGWWGKVVKPEGTGTSNAGIFGGKHGKAAGDATNVVTDYVYVRGEARSSDAPFASKITEAFRAAFTKAGSEVKDVDGKTARVEFDGHAAYPPFRIAEDSPVVVHAKRAAESIGLQPTTLFSNGGLDANWFVKHGVPTVTIGAGQHEIHTVKEFVELSQFADGCRLAVALATIEAK
ncbi:MAG: M20/M25/M40 family metallo-hydrolase [Pirellulales bacterium]|nr:M20/M25/M40 family metallo-hydrolase [Pirellulales bacterium]